MAHNGARVTDAATLERIKALVIPPAWTDVWICPHPMGHIQAVGVDARGRKQYRYHDAWRERRDLEKFDHMLDFATALPALRTQVMTDLARPDLDKQRVLACAVRLLDLGFFRIGSEGYAEENQTYGLATMRKSHVKVRGTVIEFDYVAKSGKRRIQSVADTNVVEIVCALKRRRGSGPELLAWRDDAGQWVDVKSTDINAYLKAATGTDCSAKDFRTWSATVLAAVALGVSVGVAASVSGRQRAVTRAMKEVSSYLGNTPAVCRSSYVDPRIVDRFTAGVTIIDALTEADCVPSPGSLDTHGAIEAAVLDILGRHDSLAAAA